MARAEERAKRRDGGSRDALVVLDVGTGSTRALVLRLDGSILAEAREANRLDTPGPGRAEQDPILLLRTAETVVGRAVSAARRDAGRGLHVHALVISTHMHSLLVTDRAGRPRTPILTWADTRAEAAVRAVRAGESWQALYARTGCPPHASYPLYKLMALRDQGPALTSADRAADLKSWLLWNWTGEWLLDLSLASGSGLLDNGALTWDAEAMSLAGITAAQLPRLVDTTWSFPLTGAAAATLGLPAGTPIVAGAGDGVLSSLGCGAHEVGIAAAMVGTSGAVRVGSREPVRDPAGRLFSYYLAPGHWIVGGAISNGGLVLDWLARLLGLEVGEALEIAAEIPAGAGGLVTLPLLAGERAPGYDGRASGAMFGLTLEHDRRHLTRSAVEAVAYRVRSVLEVAEEACGPVRDVRATGGLARSAFWVSLLAGVLGRAVSVPAEIEGSAIGALILGGVALGLLPDLDAASEIVRIDEVIQPDPADRGAYERTYDVYGRLAASLRPQFASFAALGGRDGGGS